MKVLGLGTHAERFDARVEGEIAGRLRGARAQHEALLQALQGLMFSLQAVRALLPDRADHAIQVLEDALDRADNVLVEAQRAGSGLDDPALQGDLARSLAALAVQLGADAAAAPDFSVTMSGNWHTVDPIVRDEAYRAAREAMCNAFRYAEARHVEAEVICGKEALTLRVRDDGKGMDQADLDRASARPRHWGLPGMRERSARLGGALEVWSRRGLGTEISLTLPAWAPGGGGGKRRT